MAVDGAATRPPLRRARAVIPASPPRRNVRARLLPTVVEESDDDDGDQPTRSEFTNENRLRMEPQSTPQWASQRSSTAAATRIAVHSDDGSGSLGRRDGDGSPMLTPGTAGDGVGEAVRVAGRRALLLASSHRCCGPLPQSACRTDPATAATERPAKCASHHRPVLPAAATRVAGRTERKRRQHPSFLVLCAAD